MSWGRFNSFDPYQGPTWSSARRCPAPKPAPCTVVVLDEEEDDGDDSDADVFIIDGAVPPAPRCRAWKGNGASGNVINIDDDEDVDEGTGKKSTYPPKLSTLEHLTPQTKKTDI